MEEGDVWVAFHLCDSTFPGGTLGNSQGLESCLQHHMLEINNPSSLKSFTRLALEQARCFSIPFVRTGWSIGHQAIASSSSVDKHELSTQYSMLDKCCDSMLINEISKRASINQGKGFLRIVLECYPSAAELIRCIIPELSLSFKYHHAPLFGLACACLKVSLQLCERMYLRLILRDLVSAAARLNIIGPIEGSCMQVEFVPFLEELLSSTHNCDSKKANSNAIDEHFLGLFPGLFFYKGEKPLQSVPIIDLIQSRHNLLYSRLFSS